MKRNFLPTKINVENEIFSLNCTVFNDNADIVLSVQNGNNNYQWEGPLECCPIDLNNDTPKFQTLGDFLEIFNKC
jgi:hypothetical protein